MRPVASYDNVETLYLVVNLVILIARLVTRHSSLTRFPHQKLTTGNTKWQFHVQKFIGHFYTGREQLYILKGKTLYSRETQSRDFHP